MGLEQSDQPTNQTNADASPARQALSEDAYTEYVESRCAKYGPLTIPSGIAVGLFLGPWAGLGTSMLVGTWTCGKEFKDVYDHIRKK